MKILVREIPPRGLPVDQMLQGADIGLTPEEVQLTAPLDIKGNIKRVGDTVLAQVQVKSRFSFSCARCLADSETGLNLNLNFDYPIDKSTEFVDVGEDIRQEIILNLNPRLVCSEDCKGLCKGCGADLNKEQCKCGSGNKNIKHSKQEQKQPK